MDGQLTVSDHHCGTPPEARRTPRVSPVGKQQNKQRLGGGERRVRKRVGSMRRLSTSAYPDSCVASTPGDAMSKHATVPPCATTARHPHVT